MQERELEQEAGRETHCVTDHRLGPGTRDQLATISQPCIMLLAGTRGTHSIGVQSHSSGKS